MANIVSNIETLYNIIARIFEVAPSEINDGSSPQTLENWDSFRGLILFDELETTFGIKFSLDDLLSIRNVHDLKENLARRGALLYE
jgi:acyl carrier protein